MKKFELKFKAFGSQAILIEWPAKIDDKILDDIIQFTALVSKHESDALLNYTPAYNSLLLQYSTIIDLDQKRDFLLKIYISNSAETKSESKMWEIPVCYDDSFGIDLHLFFELGLTNIEVVRLHSSVKYRVYMIGFLPGFLYLGGLPSKLHLKRKQNPRPKIFKGSIAIGGKQTGIYPIDSPGGWQIIGRTPITLFDYKKQIPCQIQQGDYVKFTPISIEEYHNLLPQ